MKALRTAATLVLLAVGVALLLLALDVHRWQRAVQSGDQEFVRNPSGATWRAHTTLPAGLSQSLLGLNTALRFRQAAQAFVGVQAQGEGYDNGISETGTRGELEARLASLGLSGDRAVASAADNLLAILAFDDATASGPIAPAPTEQSMADFQAAIRLDPNDVNAKYNLELLLRLLVAKGVRRGASNNAGGVAAVGHHGAGGGIPGRGY
jgi:hypothetical protein